MALRVRDKYEWSRLDPVELQVLQALKKDYHQAIQNVAAVGRTFSDPSDRDEYAVLQWVPGLWRLAGAWVEGLTTFRSSISFHDFTIYLVDEKVNTLASIGVGGKTQNQILVWLEQQIISLKLSSSHLTMRLPYEMPSYPTQKGIPFEEHNKALCELLGGYFHNAFFLFSAMKEVHPKTSNILTWPERLCTEMDITLKETGEKATDTFLCVGFSPGDRYFEEPYFYVTSRPFIPSSKLRPLKTRGFWHEEDWIGAVYFVKNLWDSDDQLHTASYFFDEAIAQMKGTLLS